LARTARFEKPPKQLLEELANDDIKDYWEATSVQGSDALPSDAGQPEAPADYQPVIGILTQPVSQSKKAAFNYKDYILEVNQKFIKWAGSRTVAIPYDISDEDLGIILP